MHPCPSDVESVAGAGDRWRVLLSDSGRRQAVNQLRPHDSLLVQGPRVKREIRGLLG